MKHARPDYNRFQDPATICQKYGLPVGEWKTTDGGVTDPNGNDIQIGTDSNADLARAIAEILSCPEGTKGVPEDEPVFIIRGQDPAGAETVRDYAARAAETGAKSDVVTASLDHADVMERWTKEHPHGPADLPTEKKS